MDWNLPSLLTCLIISHHSSFATEPLFHLVGSSKPIFALLGEKVTLPCHTKPPFSVKELQVIWRRPDLNPEMHVHFQRNGHEEFKNKFSSYQYRTSLFTDKLDLGNVSLKLERLELSDEGNYSCEIPSQNLKTVLQLFVGISKQHWVIGPAQPIVALPGDDVILPCHLLPAMDVSSMTVEWSRRDLKPPYVHVLQEGREMLKEMNSSYRDRTALFTDRLFQGNVSLKLSRVNLSDEGLYRCFLPSLRSQVTESMVQLRVGSLSPPTVSVVAVGNGAVVLRCEVRCWHCVPEIEWSREGTVLPADNANHRGDGFVVYRSNVTVLRSATNRFTCKVQVRMFNQTSLAVIEVPGGLFPTDNTCDCAVAWSLLGVLVLVVPAVLCYKFLPKRKSGKSKEPADELSINIASETEDRALIENQLNALTSNTRCDEKTMLCRDEDGEDDKGSIMTLRVPGSDAVLRRFTHVSHTPPLSPSFVVCTPPK